MIINKNTPQFIKKCLKLIPISVLLLLGSCVQDETLSDADLSSVSQNNWSTNSEELYISNITASTEQSDNPVEDAYDVDPNLETRWSGQGTSVEFIIDLGSLNKVDYLMIALFKGDERKSSFDYEYSNDKNSWRTKKSKTSSGSTEGLERFDLANDDSARYIRLTFKGTVANSNGAAGDWNSVLDIEVHGTPSGEDPVVVDPGNTYVSIPATIQAEDYVSQYGTNTENTDDVGGGENVGWIETDDYLTYNVNIPSSGIYSVDFRVASPENDTKFDFYQGNTKLASISKEATGNWQNWTTTSKTVNLSSGNQTFKILATGSKWNINWIKFNNEEIVDPPTVDPPTGGSVEDILGDFWKITMPYDQNGNDSGNVSDPNDRNRNAYEYYDLNAAASDYPNNLYVSNGEVFFVSHCGGATTNGSIYPRCELRQLDSNGDDELISFSKDQSLDVTVRAVKTPVEKPEVCMVQLKGSSGGEIVRVDFTQDDEGLHLTRNEKTEDEDKDVIDYDLGDRLQVRITLNSSKVRLQLNNLDNGDTYDETWSHNDDEGYFKVGSYVQSSITFCEEKNKSSSECTDDDRDAEGIVAVSNLVYTVEN